MNEQTEATKAPLIEPAFDLKAAIDFGKKQVIQTKFDETPVFILPSDMKVEALKDIAEQHYQRQERPQQLKQSVQLTTEDSFVEYFNRYATESSTIFVDDKTSVFTAVLDYHDDPAKPAWKRHTANYSCPKTKEWGSWIECNNKKMTQEEFALFIEDNLKEIIKPNGADMLQIAANLKAKNDVDFKSAIRLDNGQVQFAYTETVSGQAGLNGQMQIPEKIKLIIAPYFKGAAYEIEARFRYRITPQGLQMWYTLIRPHIFSDDAFTDIVEKVKSKIDKGHLVHGTYQN